MNMDIVVKLRESNAKLVELENSLDRERDGLVNHAAINQMNGHNHDNTAYYKYLSLVERYTAFSDDYVAEMLLFKQLLKQSANLLIIDNVNVENMNINVNENENEIAISDHLSTPIFEDKSVSYSNYNDDNNTTISREIAASNIVNESVLDLPKIQPKPNTMNVSNDYQHKNKNMNKNKVINKKKSIMVTNNLAYKYEANGFDIWKRNKQRPIYQETALKCIKISNDYNNDDDKVKAKLKRFLIKRGGFKANCIEQIDIIKPQKKGDEDCYAIIKVRALLKNIEICIDKMNSGKKSDIIWIHYANRFIMGRRQSRKLFVSNFDILTAKDHRSLTDMFLKFGDLENDIFINRNKNGNPYAFVTFRTINDAISCEKNQNLRYPYNRNANPLKFNGRTLEIQYVNENKNKKNKKVRKRHYYNH